MTYRVLMLAGLALMFVGCRSVEVQTFSDPRFTIPQPATYAWEAGGNRLQGVLPRNRTALQAGIRRGVTKELDARGWRLGSPATADVLVRYIVGAHTERVATKTATGDSSFGGRSSVALEEKRVRAGELAIDLIHPQAGVLMWRGIAVGTLTDVPDPQRVGELAEGVAGRILKRLP